MKNTWLKTISTGLLGALITSAVLIYVNNKKSDSKQKELETIVSMFQDRMNVDISRIDRFISHSIEKENVDKKILADLNYYRGLYFNKISMCIQNIKDNNWYLFSENLRESRELQVVIETIADKDLNMGFEKGKIEFKLKNSFPGPQIEGNFYTDSIWSKGNIENLNITSTDIDFEKYFEMVKKNEKTY